MRTQVDRLADYLRDHPGASCAVCDRSFASPGIRGRHERAAHPDWSPSPSLRRERAEESRERWRVAQGKSGYFLRLSNRDAAAFGWSPLPLSTVLPTGPCSYCGGLATGWDHVVPLSKGGAHAVDNLVPSCYPCNRRKHDTDAAVFRIPSRVTVRCSWCWTPIVRRRDELLAHTYATCSRSHRNLLQRWGGYAFGNPAFAGPRHRLEATA